MNNRYATVNILDVLESGEMDILDTLSAFSCPRNPGIEDFIRKNAVDFARKKQSITYLVFDLQTGMLAGYFAVTFKTISISEDALSKTAKKRVERFSTFDSDSKEYTAAAYLIAQFGKNYALGEENRIDGTELMSIALDVLEDIQHRIGGGIVYLDAEDNPKLKEFYENRVGFRFFGERYSKKDEKKYMQYLRLI